MYVRGNTDSSSGILSTGVVSNRKHINDDKRVYYMSFKAA